MAVISTIVWYVWDKATEYRLETLVLVSWGTTIMVFADHFMSYIEDGTFIEISVNALILGFFLLIIDLLIWISALIIRYPKVKLWKSQNSNNL